MTFVLKPVKLRKRGSELGDNSEKKIIKYQRTVIKIIDSFLAIKLGSPTDP